MIGERLGTRDRTDPRPLREYGILVSVFHLIFASFLFVVKGSGRPLPSRIAPLDLLLFGVATHKLSRLVSKESVTGVIRAPFTEFERATGGAEVNERPVGQGLRRAVGEL